MGQREVYDWLKKRREEGDQWYSKKEIEKALKDEGMSNGSLIGLSDDLFRIAQTKLVQMKGEGVREYKVVFRAYK